MAKQRRTFSIESKRDAAGLVFDQGYCIAAAVKSLGIGKTALHLWVEQLAYEREGITPKAKKLTPEQKRIQELEARANVRFARFFECAHANQYFSKTVVLTI